MLVMDVLNLLVLLIFSSSCLGDISSRNSSTAHEENYKGGINNNYITPSPKDYSEASQHENAEDDYHEKKEEDDSDATLNLTASEEQILNDPAMWDEPPVKKYLTDHSFEYEHYDFEGDYRDEDPKHNQTLMRRQINNWETSEKLFDPIFKTVDGPYPKTDFLNPSNEYFDENYPFDSNQRNDSYPEETEGSYQVEPPQYYQKNYYYNYYPLVRARFDQNKLNAPKFGNDEELLNLQATNLNERIREKKTRKKNPCKLYLQFLRYAFKELDKNSEYYDDVDEEEYVDWEGDGSHRIFATQLLGPTLYIDNSGRVFQVNSKGNSIQTVEGINPPSKDTVSEKDIFKLRQTTPNYPFEPRTEIPSNPSVHNSFIITYDRPSSEFNTESYGVDENSRPMFMDEKVRKDMFPTTFSMNEEEEEDTTYTEPPYFITTTSVPRTLPEEYYGRSGLQWAKPPINKVSNKSYSSVGSPLYLHRHQNTTYSIPTEKNHFQADTLMSLANKNEKDPNDCNDKMLPCPDTFNITYPLNGYCNRYVSCESGIAVRRTCPDGFHFNIITKSCDFPHNSFCSYYCPQPNGRFGVPGDCSGYFICENYIPEYRMCPPRMHWDVRLGSCTFAAISSCPMKCSSLSEIKPYTGDCKAYIICLNGIPYYHKCPPKFMYNKENQTCIPENHFYCKDDPKLMTKTSNPSSLCKDVDQKLGTKAWCSYYYPNEYERSDEKPPRV